ncbi:MAG: tRNA lysidine(34) synthetase TilS [Anaerolineaceae bacterium]|nr:tRNA lysidine(34) synthetase TilS [Anaerolineaceae bacterium]
MIQQTVLNVLAHYKRLSPDAIYVLAVSGGMDSLVLLHICTQIQTDLDAPLHVATLNHSLRGDAGVQDARYVVQIAQKAGLIVHQHTVDTPLYAVEHNLGTELAARQLRYDWLASIARSVPNGAIVTAHHADDQAETLLLHIMRGAGLRGLRGMQTVGIVPGHEDVSLLRPLLAHTRDEIAAYSQQHGLESRHDPTNDDTSYRRNAIRHTLMPALTQFNPNIVQALSQLADNVSVDLDLLDQLMARDVLPQVRFDEQRAAVSLSTFHEWHPALQRRMMLDVLNRLAGGIDISYERTLAAVELALTGRVGKVLEFSSGWRLRVGYDDLFIEHESQPLPTIGAVQMSGEFDLPHEGQTQISPDWVLHTSTNPPPNTPSVWVPDGARLWLRTRRPGDAYGEHGESQKRRKLKEWFIDRKVDKHLRDRIPLLCVDDKIVAVCALKGWDYVLVRNKSHKNAVQIGFWLERRS